MPGVRIASTGLADIDEAFGRAALKAPPGTLTLSAFFRALVLKHLHLTAQGSREQRLATICALKGTPHYRQAVQRFADEQKGLAVTYARRWRSEAIPQEDLTQQAMLGLLEAIRLWDPCVQTKFSSYAIVRMRYSVQRYVEKKEALVHTPQNVLADRRKIHGARKALLVELGQEPEEDLLLERSGLTADRFERALVKLTFTSVKDER